MKKLAALLIAITAAVHSAAADPLPFGCYVTDVERNQYTQLPTCYSPSDDSLSWLTPGNTSTQGLVDAYGYVTATHIIVAYNTGIEGRDCDIAYKKKVALEKRLRRACGSKCNRIK